MIWFGISSNSTIIPFARCKRCTYSMIFACVKSSMKFPSWYFKALKLFLNDVSFALIEPHQDFRFSTMLSSKRTFFLFPFFPILLKEAVKKTKEISIKGMGKPVYFDRYVFAAMCRQHIRAMLKYRVQSSILGSAVKMK